MSHTTPVKSHLLLAEKEQACVIFLGLIYPERFVVLVLLNKRDESVLASLSQMLS